jgi:hypothetical protein
MKLIERKKFIFDNSSNFETLDALNDFPITIEFIERFNNNFFKS